jgi:hypothetical protein
MDVQCLKDISGGLKDIFLIIIFGCTVVESVSGDHERMNYLIHMFLSVNVFCTYEISTNIASQICPLSVCKQPKTTLRNFLYDCAGRVLVKIGQYSTRPIRVS